jgi:hypothetical protein
MKKVVWRTGTTQIKVVDPDGALILIVWIRIQLGKYGPSSKPRDNFLQFWIKNFWPSNP